MMYGNLLACEISVDEKEDIGIEDNESEYL